MRVAYVTMQFPAPTETFACSDVEALRGLGVEVHVFTLRPPHARHEELVQERDLTGVPIKALTAWRALVGLGRGIRRPLATAGLVWWLVTSTWRQPSHLLKSLILLPVSLTIAREVETGGFDVVHLFWGHYPAIVGRLIMRQPTRPVVSVFLGAYDLLLGYAPSRDMASRADLVFTHSRANLGDIVALGVRPDRIRVVYRGLPTALVTRLETGDELSRAPRRVLSVARLIPEKRMEKVLEVFASVVPRWPDASLVVLGEGPERRALERMARTLGIQHQVVFRGHVPRDEVVSEMRRSSALLMLSTKESERLPNVVKEAMAAGCVPVVARTPGIEELVLEGISGFIVEPDRLAEAGSHMERIFHGEGIDALRAAGLAHVRARFDAAVSMQAYREAWASVVDGYALRLPVGWSE